MEAKGQLLVAAALLPGREPRYPLTRRLGAPNSRSESFGQKKNLLVLPVIERVMKPVS